MSEPPSTGPRRGELRVYLGAAPGVGKTFQMLGEGRRRRDRGTDVVIGLVETHGRARTAEEIGDLEVVPRRRLEYRDAVFEEMDVDAILARRPEVALVDELAHTNVPGSRNEKRWQDVEELLDAGITVISTLNLQHLESIKDVVERITGVPQRETIPDEVVRAADQIELVDMTPEALRRRMAHGNIYGPDTVDAALANYFRLGNLAALRELALIWMADQVDDALDDYRRRYGISEPWETRERVLVAITGAPGTENLIRRAARIAQRTRGELMGVHVHPDTGLSAEAGDTVDVADHRRLLEECGGQYREVSGGDVAAALVGFARAENVTQLVLGASRRSRWQELVQGSVVNRVVRLSSPIDVHVISTAEGEERPGARLPVRRLLLLTPLPYRRQAIGWATAACGLPLLTLALASLRTDLALPSVLLLYLALAVAVAAIGGILPALPTVLAGLLLADWYFTPPFHTLRIDDPENLLALVIYAVVAGIVGFLVDRLARVRHRAARAGAEAEVMAALAGSLAEPEALAALVGHLRATFGMDTVALLRRVDGRWRVETEAGAPAPASPDGADIVKEIDGDLVLAMSGGRLASEDHRVLNALAGQLTTAVETRRLQDEAARAASLAQANDLRAALLQAVSHDLRTPLASIKASISSIRQPDVTWAPEQIDEFNATIEDETDRLDALVANLLDMSRIQAGALQIGLRAVGLEEVVPSAVASLAHRNRNVVIDVPETLPPVLADPALLERALANLLDNAVAATPDQAVRIEAGAVADRVDIRVIDRGPGIAEQDRERVFQPFQRLVDHGTGVGLGLAIARGFVDAMGGELTIDDTPGGGITMVVSLPLAAPSDT